MRLTLDLSERLAAMNIDAATRASLRELQPLIAEHIDAAINSAFDQVLRFPEVKRIYGSISLDEAKRSQRQHWLDDIFAATFTETQLAHSVTMVEARQRSGLPMRWYFVFWAVILGPLARGDSARLPQASRTSAGAARRHSQGDPVRYGDILRGLYPRRRERGGGRAQRACRRFRARGVGPRQVDGGIRDAVARDRPVDVIGGRADYQARQGRHSTPGRRPPTNAGAVATTTEQLTASIQEIGHRVAQSTQGRRNRGRGGAADRRSGPGPRRSREPDR